MQVDGGLKTGLDVIKGAILGADSFGFGTGPMVALGCKYLRICHLNNCATGIATQNKTLREQHFTGLPEKVIRYFEFVANEVQDWLRKLGVKSLDELIGRIDLLHLIKSQNNKNLDLSSILKAAKRPVSGVAHYLKKRNIPYDKGHLNQQILDDFRAQKNQGKVYEIHNYDRSVGAKISGYLAKTQNSKVQTLTLNFKGIAGQSFGVWNHKGLTLNLQGDANDYVGKGMSGGRISIRPPKNISYVPSRGAIIGNTCLYGASGGSLFAAGQAGERFAVRNSGAVAVVEGLGDHGCEYMTAGTVVVLGPVGENFGAGMTGGQAFIFDDLDVLEQKINPESIEIRCLLDDDNETLEKELKDLIQLHIEHTDSRWAKKIYRNFDSYCDAFKHVRAKTVSAVEMAPPLKVVKGDYL